jgi:hypothetical protein
MDGGFIDEKMDDDQAVKHYQDLMHLFSRFY